MTHHVRSNILGNNLLFFVISHFWVCCAWFQNATTSYKCDDPCHLSLPFSCHHHHICLPVPHQPPRSLPACLAPSLWPTSTKRTVTGPFGWVFTLFSPIFANNLPPSPSASPPALVNAHQGKAGALLLPCAMLTALTWPCTPHFKCDENQPTMPWQMQPPPPSQLPLANTTLGLRLTIHENTHKTSWRPTKLPIYPWQWPSTQNKSLLLMELAHKNAPTDGIQRWGPSMRTQCHLANKQGIQYPPCSQSCSLLNSNFNSGNGNFFLETCQPKHCWQQICPHSPLWNFFHQYSEHSSIFG